MKSNQNKAKTHKEMENINELLEKVIIEQQPDLYLYAVKLSKGLIKTEDSIIIEVYKDSEFYPKAPEGKFLATKNRNGSIDSRNPSYLRVRVPIVKHDLFKNQALLEDGSWHLFRHTEESRYEFIDEVPAMA